MFSVYPGVMACSGTRPQFSVFLQMVVGWGARDVGPEREEREVKRETEHTRTHTHTRAHAVKLMNVSSEQ